MQPRLLLECQREWINWPGKNLLVVYCGRWPFDIDWTWNNWTNQIKLLFCLIPLLIVEPILSLVSLWIVRVWFMNILSKIWGLLVYLMWILVCVMVLVLILFNSWIFNWLMALNILFLCFYRHKFTIIWNRAYFCNRLLSMLSVCRIIIIIVWWNCFLV